MSNTTWTQQSTRWLRHSKDWVTFLDAQVLLEEEERQQRAVGVQVVPLAVQRLAVAKGCCNREGEHAQADGARTRGRLAALPVAEVEDLSPPPQ